MSNLTQLQRCQCFFLQRHCVPRGEELVNNGGFENVQNPFLHWVVNPGVDQIDPGSGDTPHQGINAARLGFIEPYALIFQDIAGVCPGRFYRLNFFLSAEKNLCNAAVSARLLFLDSHKNPLGNPALDILISQNSLYEAYSAFTNTTHFLAPSQTYFARVLFEIDTGADADRNVNLDDVSLITLF